jgi:hypothetical protein
LVVESGVLVDGFEANDTFSLLGAASKFILIAGILYFEEVFKLLNTPSLSFHLHHMPHHHHPHPHTQSLPLLQAAQCLSVHAKATGDFLELAVVEVVLGGVDERDDLLLLLAVGEVGGVGEDLRV